MKKYIKILRNNFKKYNIDGYVIPKNDEYFTEYSRVNRLKIISNFSGSAGLAIILKKQNYLFTDGRYTIQSQLESGKNFKIYGFEKLINCKLFKNLVLGIDPKLFSNNQIKNYFSKHNKIKYIYDNLIDKIKKDRITNTIPFFSLNKKVVGENTASKINKISKFLRKNKSDYIFGKNGDDILEGLNGDDLIRGGGGRDTLKGSNGNDYLNGSKGRDVLIGGAGADVFKNSKGLDLVEDFSLQQGDRIALPKSGKYKIIEDDNGVLIKTNSKRGILLEGLEHVEAIAVGIDLFVQLV